MPPSPTSKDDRRRYFEPRARLIFAELASAIEEAGLSEAEVARRNSWSVRLISRMRTGYQNMTLRHLFDCLDTIGMSHREFFARLVESYDLAAARRTGDRRAIVDLRGDAVDSVKRALTQDEEIRGLIENVVRQYQAGKEERSSEEGLAKRAAPRR